jgi:precorrin-8X/cobalt-precorrin-8 methylmutase
MKLEKVAPHEIESRSFEIIESELARPPRPEFAPIIKRVIHATADFDFADLLIFSNDALAAAFAAIRAGEAIVADTNMALAGINKKALGDFGLKAYCFMADGDVAEDAGRRGVTRAAAAADKAARLPGRPIFAIGNAPTAALRLLELMEEKRVAPSLIIGVPVGFVNAAQSKELVAASGAPHIVAAGRKGGSPVAAAIVNALLYLAKVNYKN